MEKFINVYKASAGSGKTYTLTHEYIDLILRDEQAYRHVLAVTFTNKATDEMKRRILKELYRMGQTQDIKGAMARNVLIKILHDYPAFSISTIDKFFQGVMRAFARELGRMATYSVELDEELVRMTAIDNLFADLDKSENSDLLAWLIDFSLERIENGESWKISSDISKLSKSLFSEDFKIKNSGREVVEQADRHAQMKKILRLKKQVTAIVADFEKQCREIGKEALSIMKNCDLECCDFKGGARSAFNIFGLLAVGERVGVMLSNSLVESYGNVDAWYTKSKKADAYKFEQAYSLGLNDCIGKLIELYEKPLELYNTAKAVLGNLNSLGILESVYSCILEYCKEKNIILLSETTELLGKIIDGNDTPFIYEKVGTWINNFMLDEFQDTSLMQWRNFIPLLADSVANGEKNLIVGDVKQSIYRFRNSDWEILESGIKEEFGDNVGFSSLDVNWRSARNIVEFNNSFFEAAAREAKSVYELSCSDDDVIGKRNAERIEGIYSNFRQKVPPQDGYAGYVNVNFLNKKALDEIGVDYDVIVNAHVIENVKRLLDKGYRQGDIGILVRWNSEGASVARALLAAGYRVISSDSLTVSSSAAVIKAVNMLKWLDDPKNISVTIYSDLLKDSRGVESISNQECEELRKMPLYQMCEQVIRCFLSNSQKEDIAFLQAFLDMAIEYSSRYGSNLSGFLKWWDESGIKKSISSPSEQDAIQVMTVHKAKGLAFEAVIIPYFCETLDHAYSRMPLLWSTAASSVLEYDGPLPVKYAQTLKNTLFSNDYYKEKLAVFIDNLNIAYVAFTRPRRELVVIASAPDYTKGGGYSVKAVSHILYGYMHSVAGKENGNENCNGGDNSNGCVNNPNVVHNTKRVKVGDIEVETDEFILGETESFQSKDAVENNLFCLGDRFINPLNNSRIKTSLQSGSINDELSLRDNGILMHDIFATIATPEDAMRLEDGECKERILELIKSVEDRGWFSDKYTVFRECSVLQPDGSVLRPDRVLVCGNEAIVIDYKFGEYTPQNKKYHKQVQKYMQLLMDMGYTAVSGYLWYMKESFIEAV